MCTALWRGTKAVYRFLASALNISVQYNGGLLPDIILLTRCYWSIDENSRGCADRSLGSHDVFLNDL